MFNIIHTIYSGFLDTNPPVEHDNVYEIQNISDNLGD